MLDFKFKVFYSAAQTGSFTRAAEENYITQPAVSKQVKLLEQHIGCDLFSRAGGKLVLTRAGEILKNHIDEVVNTQKSLQFDLGILLNEHKGLFTLGASTTIAQYIIPKILLKFSNTYPKLEVKMISGNTTEVEHAMLEGKIDLGIVEGLSHRSGLSYIPFMDDRLVVVCHKSNPLFYRDTISVELLKSQPIILRERGSGTLEVIDYSLRELNLRLYDLNVKLYLGSTESIKNALCEGTCIAIVSEHSVKSEIANGTVKILEIQEVAFSRELAFITPVGGATGIADSFIQFAMHNL